MIANDVDNNERVEVGGHATSKQWTAYTEDEVLEVMNI
jgi:hypothetical protein